MTSRKSPPAFADLVDELGRRQGRSDLREWSAFGSQDEDKRLSWLAAHPNDPLALDARKKREKDLGIKPAPAREAIGAAALAAASLRGTPPPASALNPPRTNGAVPLTSDGAIASANLAGEALGFGTLVAVSLAIGGMLVLAWAFRSQPAPTGPLLRPAISNASLAPEACPAGTVPRSLLRVLEPEPITDDTKPVLEPGPIIDDTVQDRG